MAKRKANGQITKERQGRDDADEDVKFGATHLAMASEAELKTRKRFVVKNRPKRVAPGDLSKVGLAVYEPTGGMPESVDSAGAAAAAAKVAMIQDRKRAKTAGGGDGAGGGNPFAGVSLKKDGKSNPFGGVSLTKPKKAQFSSADGPTAADAAAATVATATPANAADDVPATTATPGDDDGPTPATADGDNQKKKRRISAEISNNDWGDDSDDDNANGGGPKFKEGIPMASKDVLATRRIVQPKRPRRGSMNLNAAAAAAAAGGNSGGDGDGGDKAGSAFKGVSFATKGKKSAGFGGAVSGTSRFASYGGNKAKKKATAADFASFERKKQEAAEEEEEEEIPVLKSTGSLSELVSQGKAAVAAAATATADAATDGAPTAGTTGGEAAVFKRAKFEFGGSTSPEASGGGKLASPAGAEAAAADDGGNGEAATDGGAAAAPAKSGYFKGFGGSAISGDVEKKLLGGREGGKKFSFSFGRRASGGADGDDKDDTKGEPKFKTAFSSFGTNFASKAAKPTEGGDGGSKSGLSARRPAKAVKLADQAAPTGEENEEKVFTVRAKVFRLDPVEREWKERGVGDLTININPEGKARLVMRSEKVHRVCINAPIFAATKVTPMEGKRVQLVSVEDGAPRTFMIRVPTRPDVGKLTQKIRDLIAASAASDGAADGAADGGEAAEAATATA